MFCPNCGYSVKDGETFCSECGSKIEVLSVDDQGEKIATPSEKKIKLVELANKKELRTNIAVALLICSLFAPIFSILGIMDFSAWRIINISVFNNIDIPGGGAALSAVTAQLEAQIPSSLDFGMIIFDIAFYVFALASIGVFIGNIRANKKVEERFALAGIISGVLLFVSILVITGEIESMIKANMGDYDVYSAGMAFSEEMAGVEMVMSYLSPFKLLSVGYWGSMLLYVASFVFNKKRTDA